MSRPSSGRGSLLSRWLHRWRASTDAPSGTLDDLPPGITDARAPGSTLQAYLERKRINEKIREREFSQLRQLRQRQAEAGPASEPRFQAAEGDLRAGTLRKINEIEAQMAGQWLGPRPGAATPPHPAHPEGGRRAEAQGRQARPDGPEGHPGDDGRERPSPPRPSEFSASRLQAMEVAEIVQDPEIEEAAIRFAGGDLDGAQATLQALLEPSSPRATEPQAWLALFDLYVATGKASAHDALALAYAERLGRSAPPWRVLWPSPPAAGARVRREAAGATPDPAPDASPYPSAGQAGAGGVAAHPVPALWSSPARLDAAAVGLLREACAHAGADMPWRLDWSALVSIEDAAVAPLAALMDDWARRPVWLDLAGTDTLAGVLARDTPCGEPAVPVARWLLRLQALRVLHRADAFELAALDYCVTYEVSPPSWDSPANRLLDEEPSPAAEALRAAGTGPVLSGELLGEGAALAAWWAIEAGSPGPILVPETVGGPSGSSIGTALDPGAPPPLVIDCARLVRIDFQAAGTLLDGVQARVSAEQPVECVEVHRLVAGLFHVIGLGAVARIRLVHD